MKKLFVLFALILMTVTVFSQVTGREVKTYYIATETTKLPYNIEPGNLLYVGSTGNTYLAASIAKAGRTPATLKAAATVTLAAVANSSYYVDTATAQRVRGIKTFYSAPAFALGSVSGNMGIGANALNHATTGDANVAVGASSLAASSTGTLNTAVGYYSGTRITNGNDNTLVGNISGSYITTGDYNTFLGSMSGQFTTGSNNTYIGTAANGTNTTGAGNIAIGYFAGSSGSTTSNALYISNKIGGADTAIIYGVMGATPAASTLQLNAAVTVANTLTGSSLMRGSATFTTTGTRVAVYIPGCATTDYCFVQITATGGTDRPVVGDVCSAYPKTDSLIVQRQAGTTSGLAFDWYRVK